MAQTLLRLAARFELAVVLVNQMTTKGGRGGGGGGGHALVPALGESWGHASTIRMVLHWDRGERKALLYKSPSMKEETVAYAVTKAGIRDVEQLDVGGTSAMRPEKRLRLD